MTDAVTIRAFLEAERARCKKATPGTWTWAGWRWVGPKVWEAKIFTFTNQSKGHKVVLQKGAMNADDLAFATNARTALPQALAYIAELLAEREARMAPTEPHPCSTCGQPSIGGSRKTNPVGPWRYFCGLHIREGQA